MSTNGKKRKSKAAERKPARAPKPRTPTNGKAWPRDRWHAPEEPADAHVAFLEGAHRLIGAGRKPWEWTEAERLGMQIVTSLGALFQAVPSVACLPDLRRAAGALSLDRLAGIDSLDSRRVQCVEYIASHAEHCRTAPWRDDPEQRQRALDAVIHNFGVADEGLAKTFSLHARGVTDEKRQALEARILKCDPGSPSGVTPERVLAEIIVLDCDGDALGYGPMVRTKRERDGEGDEDIILAIRQRLATVTSRFFSSDETA